MKKRMMKAAVLEGPRRIEVKEVPVPEAREGEIQIKVSACGVCGSDVHMWKAGKGWGKGETADFTMGHEFCGVVTNPLGYVARTMALFVRSVGLGVVDGRPDGDDGNEDWLGYKGIVMRHGVSLSKAFNRIRKDLGRIAVPMFVMHDRGDRTVPYANLAIIEKFCKDWIRVDRRVEMKEGHHSHHALLMYHSVQEGYTDEIIAFLKEVV